MVSQNTKGKRKTISGCSRVGSVEMLFCCLALNPLAWWGSLIQDKRNPIPLWLPFSVIQF